MRQQSPTKVTFNYNHKERTLYEPKLIQSGYIIGEPVAYTDPNRLAVPLSSYSPQRPKIHTEYIGSSRLGEYRAP